MMDTQFNCYSSPPGAETLESFCLSVLRSRGAGVGFAIGSRALAGQAEAFFNREILEREIRQSIHNLRVAGEPICSSTSGFFWPSCLEDVLTTVEQQFRCIARTELVIARRLRESGRRLFGKQLKLL